MRPIVLVLLVLVAIYVFFVKDLGLIHQPKHAPKKAKWLGVLLGAGLGFYDGFVIVSALIAKLAQSIIAP